MDVRSRAKGLAEYRRGRLQDAISLMEGDASRVLGPAPRLVLAMALQGCGRAEEARKALASAITSFDWRPSRADHREAWIYHVLRREAERLILPDLPAFLSGERQPRDNDERLALVGVCQFTNGSRGLARLYADAFSEAPQLANDLAAGHRRRAARAAVQAGSGHGRDAGKLSPEERSYWREMSRSWVGQNLAAWAGILDGDNAADRGMVRSRLADMLAEPVVVRLREPATLIELPVEERGGWLALWKRADAIIDRAAGP